MLSPIHSGLLNVFRGRPSVRQLRYEDDDQDWLPNRCLLTNALQASTPSALGALLSQRWHSNGGACSSDLLLSAEKKNEARESINTTRMLVLARILRNSFSEEGTFEQNPVQSEDKLCLGQRGPTRAKALRQQRNLRKT